MVTLRHPAEIACQIAILRDPAINKRYIHMYLFVETSPGGPRAGRAQRRHEPRQSNAEWDITTRRLSAARTICTRDGSATGVVIRGGVGIVVALLPLKEALPRTSDSAHRGVEIAPSSAFRRRGTASSSLEGRAASRARSAIGPGFRRAERMAST